ncbi:MAG: hypothetical protein PVH68_19000, partial [Armatimonadota bacterium]
MRPHSDSRRDGWARALGLGGILAVVALGGLAAPRVLAQKGRTKMQTGVTIHRPDKCYTGYTLFCTSYEDPSLTDDGTGKIYLIDMEGNPVHRWHMKTALQSFCRLLPNGNLLYPTRDRSRIEQAGVRELDPESNIVWYYHCRIDHDYQVLDSGNLMLHTIADLPYP